MSSRGRLELSPPRSDPDFASSVRETRTLNDSKAPKQIDPLQNLLPLILSVFDMPTFKGALSSTE